MGALQQLEKLLTVSGPVSLRDIEAAKKTEALAALLRRVAESDNAP